MAVVFNVLNSGAQFSGATVMNVGLRRDDTLVEWRFNMQGGNGNLRLQQSPLGAETWVTTETWTAVP